MLRSLLSLAFTILFTALYAQPPVGFQQEKLVDGLDPTDLTQAADGRIFIAEKNGTVRLVRDGELQPAPFLQIPVDNLNERGLGSILLHPDFDLNGWFYLYYTVLNADRNRLSRFTANGDLADPGSELILMEFDELAGSNHNGGGMVFGQDGKLYLATGDGLDGAAPQNLNKKHGKVFRLNDDGSIPTDNPFYDQLDGDARAVYGYGLRNPFSMAIDPQTGKIYLSEVGNSLFEEVNEVLPGANYGWPNVEGFLNGQNAPANYQDPVHAYDHDTGCAALGAAFYNPAVPSFPAEYHGNYFYADYCKGYIHRIDPETETWNGVFIENIDRPIKIMGGLDGNLYYLARGGIGGGTNADNTSSEEGALWRVSYSGSGAPFVFKNPESVLAAIGESATLTAEANGAGTLTYTWFRADETDPVGSGSELTLTNLQLTDSGDYFCRVSNGDGTADSAPATVEVTSNQRPILSITSPTSETIYRGGQQITFAATATDPEDGTLPAEQLEWRVVFHHADHTHPAQEWQMGNAGTFIVPQVGETATNVWYRLQVRAEDSEGFPQTAFVDIFPRLQPLQLRTDPPNIDLNANGSLVRVPASVDAVENLQQIIAAPLRQWFRDSLFVFERWSDGTPGRFRTFAMPAEPVELTAIYSAHPTGSGDGLIGRWYDGTQEEWGDDWVHESLDSTIAFRWDMEAPGVGGLGEDFWRVRWTGEVEAVFSEEYTFMLNSNDGGRVWVNDQLVIDNWVLQSETEVRGTIELEAGKRYPIQVDYFEVGTTATAELRWSSPRTPRAIVPKRQLYSQPQYLPTPGQPLRLAPNPASEVTNVLWTDEALVSFQLDVFDARGVKLYGQRVEPVEALTILEVPLAGWSAGVYHVRITTGERTEVVELLKGN